MSTRPISLKMSFGLCLHSRQRSTLGLNLGWSKILRGLWEVNEKQNWILPSFLLQSIWLQMNSFLKYNGCIVFKSRSTNQLCTTLGTVQLGKISKPTPLYLLEKHEHLRQKTVIQTEGWLSRGHWRKIKTPCPKEFTPHRLASNLAQTKSVEMSTHSIVLLLFSSGYTLW